MEQVRLEAYNILNRIEEHAAYSNILLKNVSKARIRILVLGVLENKILLDFYIGKFLSHPLPDKKACRVMNLLRIGMYEILYMDSEEYAVCNELVNICKVYCKGFHRLVNGLLRSAIRQRDKLMSPEGTDIASLSIRYSYPEALVSMWLEQLGLKQTLDLMAAGNDVPSLTGRTNLLKGDRDHIIKLFEDEGYILKPLKNTKTGVKIETPAVLESDLFKNGYISIQDEASVMSVEMLAPNKGDFILDMCAAPGGKSVAAAERMENEGHIIAQDIYERKLGKIKKYCRRCGIDIIKTVKGSALVERADYIGKFDKIILDPPCSGLGVIRRRPEIKYKDNIGNIQELVQQQKTMLRFAGRYVKGGGTILYSTCTINNRENQEVIGNFLEENKEFTLEYERQLLPQVDDTDGFYISLLRRDKADGYWL